MTLARERNSNIELFRIVTMLLIVAHHYVVNSGLMDVLQESAITGKTLFYLIFGAWGKVGINCFVLITGYFMCRSQATFRKFLKLFCEVEFYQIVIYCVFLLTGIDSIGAGRIIKVLFPIRIVRDNFTSCFLLFYMLIPYLNKLLSTLDQRSHFLLVALLVFTYSILGTMDAVQGVLFGVTFNYVSWFVVLYFIGSYLRIYGAGKMERHTGVKMLFWLGVGIASIIFYAYRSIANGESLYTAFGLVSDSNKMIGLLISVYAFLYFKSLKIGQVPLINRIATSTFGVLLIHANSDAMRNWLWGTVLRNKDMFETSFAIPHAIFSVLAVFAICVLIDRARIVLLETPFSRFYDKLEPRIIQKGNDFLAAVEGYVNQGGG